MQEDTAIDIDASSTLVVRSEILVDVLKFYIGHERRQVELNQPPIDRTNIELAKFRKDNRESHEKNYKDAKQILDCIENAGRFGGYSLKIEK